MAFSGIYPYPGLPELFIKIADGIFKKTITYFIIDTFYLTDEPISPHLLRYSGFAVKYHNFIPCASYLRQPRLVHNPGTPELFIKIANAVLKKTINYFITPDYFFSFFLKKWISKGQKSVN